MSQRLEVIDPAAPPPVWAALRNEAAQAAKNEPALASLLNAVILSHEHLGEALSYQLARKLDDQELRAMSIRELANAAYAADPRIVQMAEADLKAVFERDPACKGYVQPFLFFKGYQALQTQRVAHWLWNQGRETIALYLQSRMSEVFQVDIHPATQIGSAVFIDHGTGIVIGETAVIGDDVSLLQGVTLGGTGKETGDRHPKIRRGVLIGAGAKILGNIEVGHCAKVAAGSVVLSSVPHNKTVAGVPARVVGETGCAEPSRQMDQLLPSQAMDHVISFDI
jgi:serine O-acetyltransferase